MRLPSRTEEENMATVREAHAALAKGDFESFSATIGPDYVRHCQAMPPGLQELHGTEEFFGFLEEWLAAVPGYTDTLSEMMADGYSSSTSSSAGAAVVGAGAASVVAGAGSEVASDSSAESVSSPQDAATSARPTTAATSVRCMDVPPRWEDKWVSGRYVRPANRPCLEGLGFARRKGSTGLVRQTCRAVSTTSPLRDSAGISPDFAPTVPGRP